MTSIARFNQPYYLLRPGFLLRRLREGDGGGDTAVVELPWGDPIQVETTESIGRVIQSNGVYDLAVTEALMRLADPGELALDIGANIGYMTSALAFAVGSGGRVICFEPHPAVFAELEANVARWTARPRIDARNLALSATPGKLALTLNETFTDNRGSASLEGDGGGPEVDVARLDAELDGATVGVMKIDVEGHEASVIEGAAEALAAHRIRDIVFEEHGSYPAPSATLLEGHGYTIFALDRNFFGPRLERPGAEHQAGGEAPNLLATVDPGRVRKRLGSRGWHCLRPRRRAA
jgi:FkbM family methyltransferase